MACPVCKRALRSTDGDDRGRCLDCVGRDLSSDAALNADPQPQPDDYAGGDFSDFSDLAADDEHDEEDLY